jgi:uncharacterized protein with HEPN domain
MRKQEADIQWLEDILEFIKLLEKSIKGVTPEKFYKADPLWKWGIVKLIENIGESAFRLSNETKTLSGDFHWGEIIGMRNRLVHGYDKINYITVYEVATTELKPLKAEVKRLKALLLKKYKKK